MKKSKTLLRYGYAVLLFCSPLLFNSCDQDESIANEPLPILEFSNPIEGQYTIVLKDDYAGKDSRPQLSYDMEMEMLQKEIPAQFAEIGLGREAIKQTYSFALKGFTAELTDKQLQQLQKDPRVKSIEQDYIISLGKPPWAGGGDNNNNDPKQETPWGITRVNGGASSNGTAWVIDSGIDSDHPDLNVDTSQSKSWVTKGKNTFEDGHGHGTHVAGTIAAIDNEIGVVGVAAGAAVVALRVLDNRGSGSFSWTVSALDYVVQKGSSGDVVNMSLGPRSRYVDSAVDNAVIGAAEAGLKIVIAAGNSSDDANYYSPARVNHSNVYTISAMDGNDNWASFSNYGSPVDYCAPGVSVKSCYKDGGYATMNGTSMAAPHVAGLLLLGNLSSGGTVNGDPQSPADPIAVH